MLLGADVLAPFRVVAAIFIMIAAFGWPVVADVKVSFAFNNRLISMNLPSLDYRILTSVDPATRKIVIVFPIVRSQSAAQSIAPTMRIFLLALQIEADPEGFFVLHLNELLRATGGIQSKTAGPELSLLGQKEPPQASIDYNDSVNNVHKVIMVTAVHGPIGILIILDAPIEAYEEIEDRSVDMIQSIHFEE
jgi:hypothetical protein